MSYLSDKIDDLPENPGIYKFFDKNKKLIYVGKSVSIKKRVKAYFSAKDMGPKTNLLVKNIADIGYIKVTSEFEALLLEADIIKKEQPFFNIQAKDDKSPLYIKITNDNVPQITTTRKIKDNKKFFLKGPFPSVKITRSILKNVRKIYPYCHHKNPKKPCLYVHLGLCPYPYKSETAQKSYLETVNKIKKLLSKNSKKLLKSSFYEMKKYAKEKKFEEAQKIKRQIEDIQKLFLAYYTPSEFLERPTLVDDLSMLRLEDLKNQLELLKIPRRIECYDVSNISGTNAAASMAVFINGQASKSDYRRFKIKSTKTPNDYQMIKETLIRRFKNNWPKPDLIIIDGGKGQLNIALSALNKFAVKIPVIAIVKKFEKIYTAYKILPVTLPKNSQARQLVQSARDEAHRFAISYHKLLRSKHLLG